jgi:2-polyprenyl-3-methyl-5-hydroxy-6-metoxy-1,4-benzoquinol methylase
MTGTNDIYDNDLDKQRLIASLASGGIISDNKIYDLFLEQMRMKRLSGKILDYGAGKGRFVELLIEAAWVGPITAADLFNCPERSLKIKWIKADLNESLKIEDNSFDVIVSIETIEHLENPRFTVREWFRLLKPGGTLLFSTPNNESWRAILALIVRGHFVAFGDTSYPAHITALLRKDIIRILEEVGFCESEIIYSNSGGIPKLLNISWQRISWNILRGLRYSDTILIIASKLDKSLFENH